MELPFFSLERVFFEKYINELSSDSFKVLLKLYYLANNKSDNVMIRRRKTLRRLIGINIALAESIWIELIAAGLVLKREKRNCAIYTLNAEKIKADNTSFIETYNGARNIEITIFESQNQVKPIQVTKDFVKTSIESIFGDVSDNILRAILQTVNHLKTYYNNREREFKPHQFAELLSSLSDFNAEEVKIICDRFNASKVVGQRGFRYIVGIANCMLKEGQLRIVSEENVEQITINRREEGERKFAIKLASGDIEEDNVIYQKFRSDVDRLNNLWFIGAAYLLEKGQKLKINKSYDWLKPEVTKGIE